MDDYNSTSSRQARFAEQEQEDKKQQLIDISIQHQILSPFTAFIGIETRTEQEKASGGEMILREVPIEIRDNGSSQDNGLHSSQYSYKKAKRSCSPACSDDDELDCDDEEECEDEEESGKRDYSAKYFSNASLCMSQLKKRSALSASRGISVKKSAWLPRSRSPQRRRRPSSSSDEDRDENNSNSSDTLREIISLQSFAGLWLTADLEKIISLVQQNTTSNNVNIKQLLNDYKDKDQDIVLSMIIMFIFMKYFTADELLWKPIIKKCTIAMESQLGKKEYNEMTDKIKLVV